jgi:hypothetical protein
LENNISQVLVKAQESSELWPIHLKPKDDELLSSWLVRLARAHGLKLHTFCSLTWLGKQIWNRDIDKSADSQMVETLSTKTGTPIKRVRSTTLAEYENILYEKHNLLGPTSWIMPVGVYHRTRKQFGLQYCSLCLAEDKEPYFRRKWRLAFMMSCERHQVLLNDRCPHCGAAVNFHRNELGDYRKLFAESLTLCHACRFELRVADSRLATPITHSESEFTMVLLNAMHTGQVKLNKSITTHSQLYFAGLRQLMKIVAMRNKRVDKLRRAISAEFCVETYSPSGSSSRRDVQEMSIEARRQLLGIVRCLLEEWPYRFVDLSRRHRIWSSLWLRHIYPPARANTSPAPFWLWSIVHDYLYHAKYRPSDEEMKEAIKHLKLKGEVANQSTLARLLGVAVVRRKTDL